MNPSRLRDFLPVLAVSSVLAVSTPSGADTLAQNVSWTIERPEATTTVRIVAYGDSIFAGYKGSISRVATWAAPSVDGDYASAKWGTNVEIIRRAKTGAKARDVYENKIVGDASWMETPETRVVAFEMCGNDALQARSAFAGQNGTCDYTQLDKALDDCTTYQEMAMVFINANAGAGVVLKVVTNLYYPAYDADNTPAGCVDATSGTNPTRQDVFLPYLLRMNWRTCHFASQYGFRCSDAFAEFMGSDYDTNLDGKRDVRALRYRRGESEDAYVTRIGTTLRGTLRDANMHFFRATTSYDYLQSDDTHPTVTSGTVNLGILGGSGFGSSAPRFPLDRYRNGKVPIWKRLGHERMGHALSVANPIIP